MLFLKMQIIFEAIRGISIRSDIAIDDISFQRGPCKGKINLIEFAICVCVCVV